MSGLSVGIDVGGTFTDLAAVGEDGAVRTAKVLSEPRDQSVGVVDALRALGAPPSSVERVVHGTTVVTNLLLERTGARVVLCATAGHTDLLELRRQARASLYDLTLHHPPALVSTERCVAVPGRMSPAGEVAPLDDAALAGVVEQVVALAPDAVAVALLHAHAHPAHEERLARALAERLPDVEIVRSSEVHPEIREYERAATTAAEAYARPRVAGYLARLGVRLHEGGWPQAEVMSSGGGVRPSGEAAHAAASLALSGPAGGVVGAAAVLRASGGAATFPLALTIDIGGTSADVGLIVDGEPLVESGGTVAGVPIALPRVLVETVSAGGGSIAWADDAPALRVGPRSAGAHPGPAAFGRGGAEPTVTDAHVVLGHIRAASLSGVTVDAAAAHLALRRVASALGVDADREGALQRVARAVVATADAEMARALRRVSVERGIDPRACVLVAFGGGGPLHACALAERIGARRVLVPPHAGVLSAVGLAAAPPRREAATSVLRVADALDRDALGAVLHALAHRAAGADARPGAGAERRWWLRARYAGQGHELDVPASPADDGAAVAARFAELHARRTGFTLERAVEIVSARAAVVDAARVPTFGRPARARDVAFDAQSRHGRYVDDGAALDATIRGAATVALPDATLLVADGWTARALPIGGWMLEAT